MTVKASFKDKNLMELWMGILLYLAPSPAAGLRPGQADDKD